MLYDLNELSRYNYHIHTNISTCAKPEMTVASIIACAEKAGLQEIALVDHHHPWQQDVLGNIKILKDEAEKCNTNIKLLFGAELSAFGIGNYSDSIEENAKIGYRLYAYNHYHLKTWEQPEVVTPRAYVEHSLKVLEGLIMSGRADCIAHPFTGHFMEHLFDLKEITDAVTDDEIGDMLELGKEKGIVWEVNTDIMPREPELSRRYWNIAREVGVTFSFGTDAHRLADVDCKKYIGLMDSILNGK